MSYLSISNQYSMYSNLLSQTYGCGTGMSSGVSDSLLGMYSYIYGAGKSTSSSVSSATSDYLVNLKNKASNVVDAVSSIRDNSKNDKKIAANSDNSSAVSGTYTGDKKRDDIKIDVEKIASAQVNESESLKSNSSSLYYKKASNISITTSEGKSYSFNYSAKITETDEKALNNIAAKINKANIGVSASVETDEKTKTSKLVLTGSKAGEGNDFTVSGNLAEALGIDNVKTASSDAVYSINGERRTSSSNEVKVDEELTLKLKGTTEKSATISFGKSKTNTINSARELVNAFNGLANTAYSSNDSGADRLGDRLKSIAKTYGASLDKIGVSLNSKGYLEIDEDKMDKAAENGELDKFFNSNGKNGLSYGFVNRLENLAKKAYDDPTDFLSSSGKAEVNSVSNSSYYKNIGGASYNYISAYYKYSNIAMLFSAMV
ncbi:MAG: hypothetical protein HFE59_04135 [Clostridiales bacterium]|nr:hypothetical protein [Clostridiales bacterium]